MHNIEILLEDGTVIQSCRIQPKNKAYLIGRNPSSDLRIDDSHIAPRHLEISVQDGELTIQDLSDEGGTTVNDQELATNQSVAMTHADRVVLAGRYVVHIGDAEAVAEDRSTLPQGIGKIVQSNVTFFDVLLTSLCGRLKGIVGDHQMELERTMAFFKNAIGQRIKELATVHEMSIRMNQIHDFTQLLNTILNMSLEMTGAQRGGVLFYSEEKSALKPLAKQGIEQIPQDSLSYVLSEQAFRKNEIVLVADALHHQEPGVAAQPPEEETVKSIIVAPLETRGEVLGVLYLDSCVRENFFSEHNLEFIKAFTPHASVAIYNARMSMQAVTDGMTKLYNSRYFRLRLSEELRRATRSRKPLSLIMFDIDHFQKFNDLHGHQVGDIVIRGVANSIRQIIRQNDFAARYGGKEFVIILPDTDQAWALPLAERLRDRIETMGLTYAGTPLPVTSSLGVVSIVGNNQGRDELIRLAHAARAQSKKDGRNRVSFISPDS